MKYINIKTLTVLLSTSVIMAITGCNGTEGIPSDTQLVGSVGQLPVAHAGADRTIVEGDSFTLDGKDSYDPDGEIVSYIWSSEGITKEGVTVKFDSVPYRAKPYIVTLSVTDDDGNTASDTVEITIVEKTATNLPPVAKANVSPESSYDCSYDSDDRQITLDASTSTDPEGGVLSFAWSGKMQTPAQSDVSIKDQITNKEVATTTILIEDLCSVCASNANYDNPYDEITCGILFNVDVTDDANLSDDAQVPAEVIWTDGAPT